MPYTVSQNQQIIKMTLRANDDYICVYAIAYMGLLLQPVACFSEFFVNWCLMTGFYHASANLPTKANIDRIYLELVRDRIWRKWRDQVKSKSTQEIRYNPNIVMRTGSIQIGETPHVYLTHFTLSHSQCQSCFWKYMMSTLLET